MKRLGHDEGDRTRCRAESVCLCGVKAFLTIVAYRSLMHGIRRSTTKGESVVDKLSAPPSRGGSRIKKWLSSTWSGLRRLAAGIAHLTNIAISVLMVVYKAIEVLQFLWG